MSGLAHGSPIFWAVALGPYVMTLLARFLYSQVRAAGAEPARPRGS